MPAPHTAQLAAAFIAGGIIFGGVVAHARLTTFTAYPDTIGVTPGTSGRMICVTDNNSVRFGQGTPGQGFLPGRDIVVATLVCPPGSR